MKSSYQPNRIRSVIAFLLTGILLFVIYCITIPFFLVNSDYAARKSRKCASILWLGLYRMFGLKFKVQGKIPDDQVIFVSNHTHMFDSIAIAQCVSSDTIYVIKPLSRLIIYLNDCIRLSFDKNQKKILTPAPFLASLKRECLFKKKSLVILEMGMS